MSNELRHIWSVEERERRSKKRMLTRSLWADPEWRARTTASLRAAARRRTPEAQANITNSLKTFTARARMSASALRYWADPKVRAVRLRPEALANLRAKARARWAAKYDQNGTNPATG